MAANSMAIKFKGGRFVTRNWRGAKFVKQTTNRKFRRETNIALKSTPETEMPNIKEKNGWVW